MPCHDYPWLRSRYSITSPLMNGYLQLVHVLQYKCVAWESSINVMSYCGCNIYTCIHLCVQHADKCINYCTCSRDKQNKNTFETKCDVFTSQALVTAVSSLPQAIQPYSVGFHLNHCNYFVYDV